MRLEELRLFSTPTKPKRLNYYNIHFTEIVKVLVSYKFGYKVSFFRVKWPRRKVTGTFGAFRMTPEGLWHWTSAEQILYNNTRNREDI